MNSSALSRVVQSHLPQVKKVVPRPMQRYLKRAFPSLAGSVLGVSGQWDHEAADKSWRLSIDWAYHSERSDAVVVSGWFACVDEQSNHDIFIDGQLVDCRTYQVGVHQIFGSNFPHRAKEAGFVCVVPHSGQRKARLEVRSKSRQVLLTRALELELVESLEHRLILDRNAQYGLYFPLSEQLDNRDLTPVEENVMFSIIVPVYNVSIPYIEECVRSVLAQSYGNWELCLCDDKSTRAETISYLRSIEGSDPRIKILFSEVNQNISGASNSAISMATGDYVCLLDHDDVLHRHALHHNAKALADDPEIDMLYSDEDKLDSNGQRVEPYYKPRYSRELLLANNYITHFLTVKRSLGDEVGWFRLGYEGAQDHDLILRLVEKANKVHHIPKILYHWRKIEGSTALGGNEKPYAWKVGCTAVRDAMERRGIPAKVSYGSWRGSYKVKYKYSETPKISIVIPFKDKVDLLKTCVTSIIDNTEYEDFEIVLVDNNSEEPKTLAYLDLYRNVPGIKIVHFDGPFNFSKINNYAIGEASGDIILLLNNDIQVITKGWLGKMYGFLQQETVGAVGAHLLYDDDTNQHNGIVLGIGGVAGHAFKGMTSRENNYFLDAVPRDVSGCTAACLMFSREDWSAADGLNEEDLQVAFNDVDFCLKIRSLGKEIIFIYDVKLYHFESKSRGYEDTPEKVARFEREVKYMRERWGEVLDNDPYYNPNLTRIRQDYSLNLEGLLADLVARPATS